LNSDDQLTLFSPVELRSMNVSGSLRALPLRMSSKSLHQWKSQIQRHQSQVRSSQPIAQGTLFELATTSIDLETIDPFSLSLHSFSFFRLPGNEDGSACLYFVLDTSADLVLYIGETCRSNKRWQGQHDCKRYLDNYQDLHYSHGLKTAICMAFWWEAPVQAKARQQLESALIAKWRSPFNWQNWSFWHTPFV